MIKPRTVLLIGSGMFVVSVAGLMLFESHKPPGSAFLMILFVAVIGTPLGCIVSLAAADSRAVTQAAATLARRRGWPVGDPPDPASLPESISLFREGAECQPWTGPAADVMVGEFPGRLFVYQYSTSASTLHTLPVILIPDAFPETPDLRVEPQGLLHRDGMPHGDIHFRDRYRVHVAGGGPTHRLLTAAVTAYLTAHPGFVIEVTGGTLAVWWTSTPTRQLRDTVRNANRTPGAIVREQLETVVQVAEKLIGTSSRIRPPSASM